MAQLFVLVCLGEPVSERDHRLPCWLGLGPGPEHRFRFCGKFGVDPVAEADGDPLNLASRTGLRATDLDGLPVDGAVAGGLTRFARSAGGGSSAGEE